MYMTCSEIPCGSSDTSRQFSVEDLEMLSLCRCVIMPEHTHKHPVQAKEPESHYVLAKKQQSATPLISVERL